MMLSKLEGIIEKRERGLIYVKFQQFQHFFHSRDFSIQFMFLWIWIFILVSVYPMTTPMPESQSEPDYYSWTVVELKDELRKRKLPVSGTKATLVRFSINSFQLPLLWISYQSSGPNPIVLSKSKCCSYYLKWNL